jgi:hypothetical protein
MSDPYEREAAKAAIKVLQRELAEAQKEIENLNRIIAAANNSASASHLRAIEYQSQRDALAEAVYKYAIEHAKRGAVSTATIDHLEQALAAVKGGRHE